jgi:hypothetical protein
VFLRQHTHAHLHTDLIAGLPGEDLRSFGLGFDRLLRLEPHEIQVGILKRLRGTPISRHDLEWGMIYSERAPYEVLRTSALPFEDLQHLKRFARAWDLVSNSGRFSHLARAVLAARASGFEAFSAWTTWLHAQIGDFTGLSPARLSGLLVRWLEAAGVAGAEALAGADALARARAAEVLRAQGRALRRQAAHVDPTQEEAP